MLTSSACHVYKVELGQYFTKELHEVENREVEDGVKMCGASIVKFDRIWDTVSGTSSEIGIFATDVFQLDSDRWLVFDRD